MPKKRRFELMNGGGSRRNGESSRSPKRSPKKSLVHIKDLGAVFKMAKDPQDQQEKWWLVEVNEVGTLHDGKQTHRIDFVRAGEQMYKINFVREATAEEVRVIRKKLEVLLREDIKPHRDFDKIVK